MKSIARLSCGRVLLFLSSLFSLSQLATCEIQAFNLLLRPDSESIHMLEGFLLAPGTIDLSELMFLAVDSFSGQSAGGTGDGGNRRRESADGDFSIEGSSLDLAVFLLPEDCESTRTGCDLGELGIGARDTEDTLLYCCDDYSIEEGVCTATQYGRLIMNTEVFAGSHRLINVPDHGEWSHQLTKYGTFEETENGHYAVIFANCNDDGRNIIVEGRTIWKSRHGYLPGDLFGLMHFYAAVFLFYFALLLWYGVRMKMFEESNIPIQTWIFGTMCMGTLEIFFRAGDLFVWNEDGSRFLIAYYIGIIVGVLKRGISRCLMVMVSLGWGVTRDELGPMTKKIHILGVLYIVISLVAEILDEIMFTGMKHLTKNEEEELFDVVTILNFVIVLINLIFYFWIIDSLSGTMEYLENMKQTRKLLRYLRLRMILMFSILFGVMWAVFGIVDTYDQGIVTEEAKWVIDASIEINYLFILVAVAYMWRPQENAKDYAYVMELPSMSAAVDDDDDEGMIELSDAVPCASDDWDDEELNVEIQS
uniref:GOST seven transmembrane domain-containing protein n=1 Tax=Pseudo-nitzschia delicatissima TaxID=44447 RepID=A0A7S0XK24_9STRA|mmetsp:Transcript_1592/g.3721  ORF Transcript_1592/g.3721 Transcript_1592/m.3721 type:complete len:534 (+) Transcript_1592:120-1721(+)|eukprot:CAMPEP_0116093920 /NCGR_PEP_ID=MMETSP0327-20121206/8854_1 /TAXON_ID=44447 /ORGANISM="Pseudo-nitzschia delicatissima, Strain B596" /LENGTH=533 /DNA_ID=CAMNT_0003585487 /DNA_START=58 /DNA_END=1659 /DNA_ORIENTATION=-